MAATVRLLVEPASLVAGRVTLAGDDHHYLFRVRRLRPGDRVVLFDGEGREAVARVAEVGAGEAALEVEAPVSPGPGAAPAGRVTVLLSLLKGERMDWCLPKLVELGAGRIAPVATERTVVRLQGERAARRVQRWRAQVRAAAQQCRSAHLPPVEAVTQLGPALARVADHELKLVLWEQARSVPLSSALPSGPPPARVAMLVGPEGGLSDAEVEQAGSMGFVAVGLGARILRAETAAVAGLAILAYALGDI